MGFLDSKNIDMIYEQLEDLKSGQKEVYNKLDEISRTLEKTLDNMFVHPPLEPIRDILSEIASDISSIARRP